MAREGGDQSFAFASFHLGDLTFMQHYATDQLNIDWRMPSTRLPASSTTAETLGRISSESGAISSKQLDTRNDRLVTLQLADIEDHPVAA